MPWSWSLRAATLPLIGAIALFLIWPGNARGAQGTPGVLVMLGPTSDLRKQIEYLASTWPRQHAIAVVRAGARPKCKSQPSNGTVYCWLTVRPDALILVKWLTADPRPPGDRFTIHYWYRRGQSRMEVKRGDRLLVFLAPTHGQGIYGCTVVMRAAPDKVRAVRRLLRRNRD